MGRFRVLAVLAVVLGIGPLVTVLLLIRRRVK